MTKLANCLLRQAKDFKNFDESEVVEASKIYQSRGKSEDAANIQAIEDHLDDLRTQRRAIVDHVLEQFKAKEPAKYGKIEAANRPAVADKAPLTEKERGIAMVAEGIDELISLLGGKTNMLPEEEARLIPIMSKIFRGAAIAGYATFKDSARWVYQQIHAKSPEVAAKLSIENLQAGYINIAKDIGGDKRAALDFDSIEQLMAAEPKASAAIDEAAHQAATSPLNDKPQPTGGQKAANNYEVGSIPASATAIGMPISIENPQGSIRWKLDTDRLKAVAQSIIDNRHNSAEARKPALAMLDALAEITGADVTKVEGGFDNLQSAIDGLIRSFPVQQEAAQEIFDAGWKNKMQQHYGYIKGVTGADKDHLDIFLAPGADTASKVWVIDQKNPDGSFDEHKVLLGPETEAEARAAYLANYRPGWDGIGAITSMPVPAFKAWAGDGKVKRNPLAYVEAQTPEKTTSAPEVAAEPEAKVGAGETTTTQHENATAPEHVKDETGVTVAELKQIAKAFRDAVDSGNDAEVTHIFDAPTKSEIVRLKTKADAEVARSGWLTPAQAKERMQKWRDRAAAQYDNDAVRSANSQKIVISLFDLTGKWSQPWEEAGYQVYRFDIQNGDQAEHNGETINLGDINNFSTDFFNDIFGSFDGLDVHAILAACPCTDFAVSGARHFAAKDADGRTVSSIKLVNTTLATIEYFKPSIWALENPVGRIEELTGLPPWRLSFDPYHLGDSYTKKTLIWGRFNADLPVAPVEPTEGSKMHSQYGGKSQATKNARSATPEGFAYGFFMANNAADNPALAISGKYDRLDRSAIEAAIKAGVTAAQIDEAVEDFYYMDLDDDAANEALRELAKEKTGAATNFGRVAELFASNFIADGQAMREMFDIPSGKVVLFSDLPGVMQDEVARQIGNVLPGEEVTIRQPEGGDERVIVEINAEPGEPKGGLPAVREQLFVEFDGRKFPVESMQDASEKWELYRDETGVGSSEVDNLRILDQTGKQIAYVSYNGRVWPGKDYSPNAESLYDPVRAPAEKVVSGDDAIKDGAAAVFEYDGIVQGFPDVLYRLDGNWLRDIGGGQLEVIGQRQGDLKLGEFMSRYPQEWIENGTVQVRDGQLESKRGGKIVDSESGAKKQWPKPNAYGVYSEGDANRQRFTGSKDVSADVYTLEIAPDKWVGASQYTHHKGSYASSTTGINDGKPFLTEAEAVAFWAGKVGRAQDDIIESQSGVTSQAQKKAAKQLKEWADDIVAGAGVTAATESEQGAPKADDGHWLHDEIVNLIHFKGRTQNRRALDKIVDLLKRRAAGEDIRNGKVKSHISGFKNEAALSEVLNRIVTRLEAEDKEATAAKRKETAQAKKETAENGNETAQAQQGQPQAPQQGATARRVRFISRGRNDGERFAEAITEFKDITIPELPGRNFFIHSGDNGQTVITERETGKAMARGDTPKLADKALMDVLKARPAADIERIIAGTAPLTVDLMNAAVVDLENREEGQRVTDEQSADAAKSGGWDGKPSYGDKVDTQMRDGDIGAKKNKPYASRAAAVGWIFKNHASDTHEVFQVGKDQFVLRPIAGAQTTAEKKAEATHKAAVKAAEVDAFNAMVASQDLINAEANTPGNFMVAAQSAIVKWIGSEMLLSANAGEMARVKALDSLLKDGKPVLPESFFESTRDAIKKQAKLAKIDGIVAASRLAAVEAITKANVLGDQGKVMFLEGWDHALAGKTKSTLSSDDLHQKGYEAARAWMKTPEGSAAFTGKRAKKLENTGADLRRWFDEQKAKIDAATDTDSVISAIDAATTRAELFRSVLSEGATPGAQRWLDGFRNQVFPFKRWLTERGPLGHRYGRYYSRRTSDTEIIRGYLEGEVYQPNQENDTKEQRIAVLKSAAEEYANLVRDITENIQGKTVTELSQSFEALMLRQDIEADMYKSGDYSPIGSRILPMFFKGKRAIATFAMFKKGPSYQLRNLIENEARTDESTRKAALTPPRLDRVERDGEDFRAGQNVSPETFKRTFNFADVGFGKWVGAKQDQDHLNYSFDAFGDLAKLLGIPPAAISLGGRLHFTIGALGHGKFAAHYTKDQPHPDGGTVPVINVTNTRGDGTVAHEWSHALDLTPQDDSAGSPRSLRLAIEEIKRDLKYAYNFDTLRASVVQHLKGERWWRGDKRAVNTDSGKIDNARRAIDYYSAPGRQMSAYYRAAMKLDGSKGGKKDAYWSNDKELFARAFEGWVGDAMETSNTYLVNPEWSGEGMITDKTHRGTPYPVGAERERIAEWMDALRKSLVYDDENKILMLDPHLWSRNKPSHAEEWTKALQDLSAEIPAMLEAIKREQKFGEEATQAAKEHAASFKAGDWVRPREGRETRLREKIGDEPVAIDGIKTSGDGTIYVTVAGYDYNVPGVNLELVQTKEQHEAQITKAKADEVATPSPAAEPVGELTTDDLETVFNEAAAELAESTQEQPEAPAPGEAVSKLADTWTDDDIAFLRKKVEDGQIILLASDELGLPTIHDMPSDKTHHMGFGVFRTSTPYWEGTWEAGGAMQHTPGGHAFTTVSMTRGEIDPAIFDKSGVLNLLQARDDNKQRAANLLSGRGGRIETDAERTARESALPAGWTEEQPGGVATSTDPVSGGIVDKVLVSDPPEWFVIPENDAIGKIDGLKSRAEAFAALDAAVKAQAGRLTLDDQADKTAAGLAAEAAKLGVKGIDEAMKGLVKLFGGGPGKLQSFPAGMDEDSYKQAKPHFEAALKAFQDAGKTIKDLFKFLIEQFGMGIKPYALHFAKEMQLSADLGQSVSANRKVANFVLEKLSAGADIRWQDLFDAADKAFGGTQAAGTYTVKDAYDAMEMGVNLYLEKGNWTAAGKTAEAAQRDIRNLGRMIAQLPTQTKRTAEMDEFQQFSTPPTLAYASNWVANIRPGETMMEPSAGTGDLAIFAHNAGANLILNELSSRRAAILKELFPRARVFTENAEQLNNVLPADALPAVVVMNPPFSSTAGRKQGSRDTMNGARHIEQALKRLDKGGRLVAIVGEGMAADRPAFKEWWKKIAAEYNVRANIGISGKEYAKYGTTFDNNILVIDKNGPTINTVVTGKVETVAELPALLEGIRNDRPQASAAINGPESVADQQEGDGTSADGGAGVVAADGTGSNAPDAVGAGKRPSSTRPGRPGNADSSNAAGAGNAVADDDGQRGRARSEPAGGADGSGGAAAGGTDGVAPGATGVTLGAAEKQQQGELTDSVFENYRPQRLEIKGAHEHPGKLVQSAAMAAVEPPAPTYTPNLPAEVITKGMLSNAQLESVVYAGQAHQQFLPNGERRGILIGDGTGVGKGREISGIILDNMRQGRNKAVWVSANEGLMTDAGRDFSGVGGDPGLIFFQGKTKAGGDITAKKGILFTTYPTLRGGEKKQATDTGGKQGKRRIDQLVKWLGEDFDGVIVFDEAHAMGNVVETKGKRGKKKASAQALAGVNLQKQLPKARIVYVSATGATEVNNLGYGSRLGLWGEGTAFPGVKEFVSKIMQGGVAAMELISRDMKALGMYISRSLSFDGVTYERLDHNLTPLQTDIYNELAKTWQVVLQNVEAALDITNQAKDGNAKSSAMSRFWGTHQRFFNQVITSMQTPTVIEDMRKQIAAGNAVLIQLVNTNEAEQERQAARAQADGVELEELDFTPRQALMDYVRNAFPVQAYQESTDADGNTIYTPVMDAAGNPVFDQDAIRMRDELLSNLEAIRVPENPIDAIINAFGSDKVGEVTGRGRRFVQTRDEDGNLKIVEEKRGKHAAQNDAVAFQSDKKPILIFSQAGGTGFSFHADNTAKNKRKRIHYILQPGWRADSAVQGFGRSHRTNQAQPPHYVLPTTNLKAQKRFVSSIARRLDQLGALTRGQRQATSQGLFTASDNLESKYADDALEVFFQDMYRGSTPLVFSEVTRAMGLNNLIDPKTGSLSTTNLPEIPRFLNRLLSLSSTMQDEVFGEFEKRLEEIVNFAIQQGTYDNGMQTLKAESVKKVRDDVAYTDERTGAETRYVEIDVTNPIKYRSFENAENWSKSHGDKFVGWFKNAKGDVFGISDLGDRVNADGEVHRRGAVIDIRDHRLRYVDNLKDIQQGWAWGLQNGRSVKKTISTPVEASAIAAEWEKQVAEAPKHETRREHMIVGVILPVWDRVEGHPRIYRLQTDEGERMIGRVMGPKDAAKTLKNLGLGSSVSKMAPTELLAAVKRGARAILGNGWEISKAGVSGDTRIEIKTPSGYFSGGDQSILKDQGVFFERISFRERAFIPTGADELKTFERVVKAKPVVDLFEAGQNTAESPVMGYNDPYEQLETRPGTTEAQKQVGLDALRDAERTLFGRAADGMRWGRPSVLGLALNRDFREDGGTSFTGQQVSHPRDLAAMAQVLRDPRFETFRVFYTKGDTIVGQATFSSRLPGVVYLTDKFQERVAAGKQRFDADGYWMMHNHPAGKSRPSRADMVLTSGTAEAVPGFKGHVIIDHNEYTSIAWTDDNGARSETIVDSTLGSMDMRANSTVPSEYLDARLGGPAEAVELAKRMQVKDGFIVVIGTDAALRVAVVLEIPEAAATPMSRGESMRNLAMARRLKSSTGVHALFAVVPGNYKDGRYSELLKSRLFVDVIGANGSAAARGEVSGDVPLHTTSDATGNKAKKWFVEEPAYHGTPHEVDRFSTGKIGTGEGAQAYGWGLYFASSKAVAKHYKERLSEVSLTMNGKPISAAIWATGKTPEVVADAFASGRLVDALRYTKGADGKAIAAAAEKLAGEADKDARLFNDPAASRRETLIAVRLREFASAAKAGQMAVARGRLYSVELAPEPDEYLLWDKPLSEQSEKVKAAIEVIKRDKAAAWSGLVDRQFGGPLMDQATGRDLYKRLAAENDDSNSIDPNGDRAASEYLHSIGIRGIKYLDGVSRNRPLREIKREFLAELPEDADFAEVKELLGTGTFSPTNEAVIKALQADDWLGFDYPAQALSAALGDGLKGFDASKALKDAVEAAQDGSTYNYVIFDENDVVITGMESRGNFAYTEDHELPNRNLDGTLDAAALRDLRREAAGLESPERGTFLTITEDGRAVATGQKGTRVPESFTRFAQKHGLTFDARRIAPGNGAAGSDITPMSEPMPIEYRESGAMYFGEAGSFIDRNGKTRFSKSSTADFTGYNADEIRDGLIDSFGGKTIRQLEANGLLNVMENAEAFKALFPGVNVSATAKAVFIKDRAYFFANRMRPESARIELLHEIGEHYGLERLLGKDGYSNLIQHVKDLRDNGDIHAAKAWDFVARNYPEEAEGSRRFMHEVLAQIGQNADIQSRPWWKQMLEMVKRALVRMGFTGMIRVSDIQDMVLHSLMVAARPDPQGPGGGIRGSEMANTAMAAEGKKLADDLAAQEGWLIERAQERGFAGIEDFLAGDYNGFAEVAAEWREEHPAEGLYARGPAYGPVDTESPEFKAWFGDSKVVDKDGKPLLMYHGSPADISEFKSKEQMADAADPKHYLEQSGIYFTNEFGLANAYSRGGAVYPVYLSIKNPIDFTRGEPPGWKGVLARIIAPKMVAELRKQNGLVSDVSQAIIFPDQRERLIAAGYDGIKGDGGVWIAFNATQIKSAISNTGAFDPANPNILESRAGYSREAFAANVLQELATEDALFRYPVSQAKTIERVMADVFPQVEYVGESTLPDEKSYSGADHKHLFRLPHKKDHPFEVYTTDGGRVWINVAELRPGDGGSRIYAAVANYAYNTRKVFEGDPVSVSSDAVIARTKMMLASALRFGTTEHLSASIEQENGDPDKGIPPLNWWGSDLAKIEALIHTFVTTVENTAPNLKHLRYDFAKRQFIDGRTEGRIRPDQTGIDGAYGEDFARAARIGKDSGRAAILIKSLVSSEGRTLGDDGILQTVLDGSRALVESGDLGGLFSKGNYLDDDLGGVADTLRNFPRDRATAGQRSPDQWFKPVLDGVLSSFKGSSNFGALDRSIHTQLHKAQKNRYFGETFKRVQHFMEDASRAALRPAELAPTVLPRIDAAENVAGAFKALLKGKEASADINAAFGAALTGTLDDVVYADAEQAGLTPEQFSAYREIRDAADASLDELSAAEAWGIARTLYLNAAGKLTRPGLQMKKALLESPGQAKSILLDRLIADLEDAKLRFDQLAEIAREKAPFVTGTAVENLRAAMQSGIGNMDQNQAIAAALEAAEQVKALDDTVEKVAQLLNRRDQLQREGYVPLMRFGQHYLTISRIDPTTGEIEIDENGEKVVEYFGLFESAAERDKAAKAMRELYPEEASVDFDAGTMSEEEWQRYKGVSPETVALFAGKLGIGTDEVFQEWYRLAASNRSTLKRLIHRKGTPGFSEDGARVMASFLTSNGRRASMLYHMADIQESIDDFPRQQGAEKDEAIRMVEYIQNQDEEAATPRALLFMHFLGGTVSNFLINATQPAMVTLPYVAQFVGMPRATALMKEAYRIRNKPEAMSQELRDALARADQEGKVGAQEIHHLWQETARPLANSLGRFGDAATYRAHAFMSLWGMPFAIAEHMNRQVTFITAYNAAKEKGSTADQAYSKAIQAIDETQFIYGKNNRPNWARGNIGAVIFTFKLFSLSYTELLVRMLRQNPESRKAALYMLGMLILASGLQGLPGSDDLDDLIDTIGQSFGYNVNSRLAKRKWLEGMAGKEVANFAMHGLSALTPFDVSARMSLGNLIPGTGLFKASNSRKEADLLEIVGPAGGLAMSYINTWDAVATGNWSRAATEWMPKALKDAVRGGEMLVTGEALDQRGRKVVDVNPLEAVIKAAGFNPQAIAEIGRNTRDVQQKIAFARRTENLIAEHWARGIVDGKADDVRAAKESINKWNETNPETPISVKYSAVARRAAAMRANKSERFIKAATKEMRDYAAEAIE